uniref:Pseudouridine synthase n=1 Tax=Syphacia muris TaxID=451379 RepID=A0A0N5AX05_9BILA
MDNCPTSLAKEQQSKPRVYQKCSKRRKSELIIDSDKLENKKQKLQICSFPNSFIAGVLSLRDDEMPMNVGHYVKDGIRFLNPYWSAYKAFAKARWVGRKLADVYTDEFLTFSPHYFKAACKMGRVYVNGVPMTNYNYVVQNGDSIYHLCHRHEHPILDLPIKIVEETKDLLVINKPPSMPVHACGRYKLNTVIGLLLTEYKRAGLRVLHRLDRTTSGLLLLAKNYETDLKFKKTLKDGEWKKEYVCKVDGVFPEGEVVCEQPLGSLVPAMGIQCIREDGKFAKTVFKKVWSDGKTSIVRCFPETGRTHQIRVHLQYLGYPIVNDGYYNTYDWGAEKGKGANYGKDVKQLSKDVADAHSQHHFNELVDPSYCERVEKIANGNVDLDFYLEKIKESNAEYDEICFACHTKKKIPSLNHFMLHLHCVKYETSSWSFSTELPDWAKEPSVGSV